MVRGKTTSQEVQSAFKKAGPFINIGYVLIGSVLLFAYIGYKMDQAYALSPLFLLIGLFLGFGLGLYNMVKVINQLKK